MKITNEQKTKHRIPNTNNGITLFALVITIVVMLILVAVTISMAINGGLFDYAEKAVGETKNAIDAEQQFINDIIEEYIKPNVSGGENPGGEEPPKKDEPTELPEGIKVGDYVNYEPTAGTYKVADGTKGSGYTTTNGYQSFSTEDLDWRILSIDEETGEIELVAATPTTSKLYLEGADGYNHAVDILNDMCEALYSNTKGATGRSIKVEDINEKITYDYTTYTNYGTVYQPSYQPSNKQYPNIYAAEEGSTAGGLNGIGLKGSEGVRKADGTADYTTYTGSSTAETLNATYTYYNYAPENYLKDLGINTAPAGLLNTGTTYWLASRCVIADSYDAYFGVRILNSRGNVHSHDLIDSDGFVSDPGFAVRPVVSLGLYVTLTKDTENSTEIKTVWNVEF